MLSKCQITNFKSIGTMDKPLEFAPLTIFCGTNSSGKSSVLQSILLMKQSLRMNTDPLQIALNGDIVKLGNISEVKSAFSKDDEDISVEYEIEQEKKQVKFRFDFAANETERTPNGTHINIENQNGAISFHFDKGKFYKDKGSECQIELLIKGKSIKYAVMYDEDDFLNHFPEHILMPTVDLVLYFLFEDINAMKSIADMDAIKDKKENKVNLDLLSDDPNYTKRNIIDYFKNLFDRYLEQDTNPFNSLDAYDEIVPLIRKLLKEKPNIRNDFAKNRVRIEKEIRQIMGVSNNRGAQIYIVPFSRSFKKDTIAIIRDFFGKNLFYLGPLRAEPANHDAGSGFHDGVGFKGEYTATYYENNINKTVMLIEQLYEEYEEAVNNSPAYQEPMEQVLKHLRATPYNDLKKDLQDVDPFLSRELSFWLQYIGVADSIEVKNDLTVSYIKIINGKGKNKVESLLNNVGVGVSQILPILIQCLAADFGSTIIIEQPELHLHPKMQTRLADFFLAMSLIGKQLIIETHSEYIIDKLRLRIAQAPSDNSINDNVAIYFVEKSDEGSRFKKIKLDEFAVMSEWPEGFFEESSQIAEEIFLAARKKYQENHNGKQEDDDELDVEDNDD